MDSWMTLGVSTKISLQNFCAIIWEISDLFFFFPWATAWEILSEIQSRLKEEPRNEEKDGDSMSPFVPEPIT